MSMYNLIEDNVNKFWDLANNKAGECESYDEFVEAMTPHADLLQGSSEGEDLDEALSEGWNEYWSKYNM